jgi:hypothetical protein
MVSVVRARAALLAVCGPTLELPTRPAEDSAAELPAGIRTGSGVLACRQLVGCQEDDLK